MTLLVTLSSVTISSTCFESDLTLWTRAVTTFSQIADLVTFTEKILNTKFLIDICDDKITKNNWFLDLNKA